MHLLHRHVRRKLYLTAAPGTVASTIALTSHSGFGELLYPYDDEKAIRAKLANLRFSLDGRTGAIIADEYGYDESPEEVRRRMGERAGGAEKVEMQRMQSNMGLARPSSGADLEISEPELTYEHQPLVSQWSTHERR